MVIKLKSFLTILIVITLVSSCISCSPQIIVKEDKKPDNNLEKFSVPYNENIFTLFCFLTLTFSNEENLTHKKIESGQEPWNEYKKIFPEFFKKINNPIRKSIKEDLNKIDPELIKKVKLNIMGISPKFGFSNLLKNAILQSKDKFISNKNILIKEFYEEAKIHDLYMKYKSDYEKELDKYRKILPEAIKTVRDYLHLEGPEEKEIIFIINFLDFYSYGCYIENPDKIYIYSGFDPLTPYRYPITLIHEYVHTIIGPLLDYNVKNYELFQKSQDFFMEKINFLKSQLLMEKIEMESELDNYKVWAQIIEEELTYSITYKILFSDEEEKLNSIIEYYEKNGNVIIKYFCNKLDEYERKDIEFKDFFPEMILTIDVDTEK